MRATSPTCKMKNNCTYSQDDYIWDGKPIGDGPNEADETDEYWSVNSFHAGGSGMGVAFVPDGKIRTLSVYLEVGTDQSYDLRIRERRERGLTK